MEIRAFEARDLARLKELHAKQGFDYSFPKLTDPVFAFGSVADDGRPQMALFGKITAEMFLFLDPEYADPETRWGMFLRLHEAVRLQAAAAGLADVNFWLPPEVPEGFIRKLKQLGWTEGRAWRSFAFQLR